MPKNTEDKNEGSNIYFTLHCGKCEEDLEFDPDGYADCIIETDKESIFSHRRVFTLDLSWHHCKCHMKDETPDFIVTKIGSDQMKTREGS